MPRVVDPVRRQDVLDLAVDYVLEKGVSDLSLRPVAAAVGVSPYTLLAWFGGTKDALVAAVVDAAQRRQQDALNRWFDGADGGDLPALLRRYWQWACEPAHQAYLRLFFETYALALQAPERFPGLLHGALASWRVVVRDLGVRSGVPEPAATALATETVALVFGLLLDLLTTGEQSRTTSVLHDVADRLAEQLSTTSAR